MVNMALISFFVTLSFKVKIECIPLCVLGSNFTHKMTNSEMNSKTNVFITSNLITSLKRLSNGKEHHRAIGR
jgi:hypothetical protein